MNFVTDRSGPAVLLLFFFSRGFVVFTTRRFMLSIALFLGFVFGSVYLCDHFTLRREKAGLYASRAFVCLFEPIYGTYHIGDQRGLRRACTSAQSRQSLRCSHT